MQTLLSNKTYDKEIFEDMVALPTEISETEFTNCMFINCDLSDSRFNNCIFDKCNFERCNLSNCKFPASRINDCNFIKSKIIGISWNQLNGKFGLCNSFDECDLSFNVFNNSDISGTKYIRCKIRETDFRNTVAVKTVFTKCDFFNTVFVDSDLRESSFVGSIDYVIDIQRNKCAKAKFSYPEANVLLSPFKIMIVDPSEVEAFPDKEGIDN